MSSYKRPESVLVVVYTLAGEVLLLERLSPPGWWQSVTGSLEERETPREAAVREVHEETGLAAEGLVDLGLSQRFTIAPPWRHKFAPGVTENLEHAFALPLPDRQPVRISPGEHARHLWLPRNTAVRKATSETNKLAICRVFG